MLKLRSYQEECLKSILEHHNQGINKLIVHVPTPTGKNALLCALIEQLNLKTLVLVRNRRLIAKIKPLLDDRVTVYSLGSARKPDILAQLKKQGFSLCIYDEAPRSQAANPKRILSALGFLDGLSGKLLIGFTTTFKTGTMWAIIFK